MGLKNIFPIHPVKSIFIAIVWRTGGKRDKTKIVFAQMKFILYYYTFSMYSRSWMVREQWIILNIRYLLRNSSCRRAQRPLIVFFYRTCIPKKYWTLLCPSPGAVNNSNQKVRENKINKIAHSRFASLDEALFNRFIRFWCL
jgi:hypothetical protein